MVWFIFGFVVGFGVCSLLVANRLRRNKEDGDKIEEN